MKDGFPMDAGALFPKVMDQLVDMVCIVDEQGRYVFINAAGERLLGYTPKELMGRNMIELVLPVDRERTLQAVTEIMAGHPKTHFENRYLRKDGRVVDIMWSARWSQADRVRIAVARDVTAIKRAGRSQSAVYRISEAAQEAHDLPELYPLIHRIIGELLPAENFAVALYEEMPGTLYFPYFIDARAPAPQSGPLEPGTPIARVIQGGQALLTTETAADGEGVGDRMNWLGAPLRGRRGVIGALVLRSYADAAGYGDEDRELLQYVSTQVAAAIQRKQAETRLHYMARHDPLTDLPNRTLFHDRLEVAVRRARRYDERLALLFLDLDGFKAVNDRFGHEIGDRLLIEAARRLSRRVRESDTVARIGGDEFTVLLGDVRDARCADAVAGKIAAALAAPYRIAGHTLHVTASIGIARYPQDGDSGAELLRRADAAMYEAKRHNLGD